METIELPELGGGVTLDPTPEEARALLAAGAHLKLDWLAGGQVEVRPAGFIGSMRLSDERLLRVTTKVPITNVLGLVSLAYRSMAVPVAVGKTLLADSSPLDWLAMLLVFEIEALLQRNLRQGYVEVEEDLPYIRGRIDFHRQVTTWSQPGLTPCRFADLSLDTAENRVLRATLESLLTQRLLPVLRDRVHVLADMLTGVTVVPMSGVLFGSVRVTRLNRSYEPALELCRIYFENAGVEEGDGSVAAPAFFFPMEKVFEKAVANFLTDRLPGVRAQTGGSLAAVAGEPAHRFSYTPDIVIGDPPRLVLDTKYSKAEAVNEYGGLSFKNQHAYQIVFYALALGCPGILIYPKDDRDVDATYEIEGQQFTFLTLDLQAPQLSGLAALARSLDDERMKEAG